MFIGKGATISALEEGRQDLCLIKVFNRGFCIHDKTLYKVMYYEPNDTIIPFKKGFVGVELGLEPIISLRRNK